MKTSHENHFQFQLPVQVFVFKYSKMGITTITTTIDKNIDLNSIEVIKMNYINKNMNFGLEKWHGIG